jgi:hypothetical protein
MKRSNLFSLATLAVLVVAGCAAPTSSEGDDGSSDTSEAAATSTTWIKVADCEGGAVVDVNAGERRDLQLVVRNREAASYILAHGSDYMRGMQLNAKGELIMRGSTDRGVFYPQDLRSFRGYGNQQWPIYEIIKSSGGVKVSLLGNDRTEAANWWFPNCR